MPPSLSQVSFTREAWRSLGENPRIRIGARQGWKFKKCLPISAAVLFLMMASAQGEVGRRFRSCP
jgi:hypothetical protein